MGKTSSKKETLRKILTGELKIEDLLPGTIVIIIDASGNKINPGSGKPYSNVALENAKEKIILPENGREGYRNLLTQKNEDSDL